VNYHCIIAQFCKSAKLGVESSAPIPILGPHIRLLAEEDFLRTSTSKKIVELKGFG